MGKSFGSNHPAVVIAGGAVAGLAAAEALVDYASVTVYERESYDEKRVNCGEAINDAGLIPLDTTEANGFVNDIDGYHLEIHPSIDRSPGSEPIATATLPCEPGYICDRNVLERQWARRLEERGVHINDGDPLTVPEFRDLIGDYDYIIDATGHPAITLRAFDRQQHYTGDMVALNVELEGDFSAYESYPRIFFEGYVGYAWSFPKSATRANVGIGWAGEDRPGDYFSAFERACERAALPAPRRESTNVSTIPKGPSLAPETVSNDDAGVFLVGDAAGIANRYQGEGICQAIRSSYLLGSLIKAGMEIEYPGRLYSLMRSEFRLAHLLRGVWMEFRDPELLAGVVRAIDGLTIEEITRNPRSVYKRVLRHPTLATRVLTNGGMRRRLIDAYTGSWEYSAQSQ